MGERFLKHPPKSQIERVFGGSTNFNFRIRECRPVFVGQAKDQFYWTNLAPVLLDQFGTNSTGPILLTLSVLLTLLAYDFFLNF